MYEINLRKSILVIINYEVVTPIVSNLSKVRCLVRHNFKLKRFRHTYINIKFK